MKKTLALVLTLALLLGCMGIAAALESPFEGIDVICDANGNPINLGGMEIIFGDWWSSGVDAEPTTAQEEATAEWREWIQETYNFKITRIAVSGWGDNPEFFNNFAQTGGPENYVMYLRPGTQAAPMASGLFYDLATLDCLDFSEAKWNSATTAYMTKGDAIYGMRPEAGEPRSGIFFNKRMLQEAGINPESIYDMQANGTWTWEALEDLCKKLTLDTDNDGVIDQYAMKSFGTTFMQAALASNGAEFVACDENGQYYNATGSDAFMEAANWAVDMISKYEMPSPEGANWDYFDIAFANSLVPLMCHQDYTASSLNSNMEDDFGFVMFPKGPKMDKYVNIWEDNVAAIPACYDADRAWKIAFAFNLYTNPTPGYTDDDDWKAGFFAKYRDERAVEDTIAMMRDSEHAVTWLNGLISGYDLGPDFYWDVTGLAATPAEKLEASAPQWQAYLDAANGK